jgi:hypothetical protein
MSALVYSLVLIVLAYYANALPAAPNASDTLPENTPWSKEAILALVGVLVAIILSVVGLASKTIRRRFMDIFSCAYIVSSLVMKLTPSVHKRQRPIHNQDVDSSTQLLRRRAQEWIEFNEWRAYVERRGND